VLEVGAGPYTKLRLILEGGNYSRTMKSVTLEDPLALSYIANPKVVTSYDEHQFCIPPRRCWPVTLLRVGAEVPFQAEAYDTVIMMNVLEHCKDAVAVLSNVYHALRPGGLLVFSESVYSPGSLPQSDACHPLRITAKFFQYYMDTFFKRGGRILMQQRVSHDMFSIVVEKPVVKALRKPGR
jgi:SAM-dependent methyltransferase